MTTPAYHRAVRRPPPSMPSRLDELHRHRRLAGLAIGLPLLGLVIVAGLWWMLLGTFRAERTQILAAALTQVRGLAQAYEAQTQQLLQRADLLTRLAAHEVQDGQESGALQTLRLGLAGEPGLVGGYLIDARGEVYAGTTDNVRANVADRPHFQVHREGNSEGLHISPPLVGRVSGRWVVQLSRRLQRPDGSFSGVVVVSVDPSHFASFYSESQLGRHGLTLLAGTDGRVRARRAGDSVWYGSPAPATGRPEQLPAGPPGVQLEASSFDGVRRVLAYRTLPGYPVVVAVGLAESELMAGQRQRERALLAIAAATSLALLLAFAGLSWLAVRQRRSQAAAEALQQQFEAASEASLDAFFLLSAVRDAQGRIVDFVYDHANERGARLLGEPRQALLGRRRSSVPRAASDRRFFELYCRVLETGVPAEEVVQVGPPERRGPWMQHQVVPVGDGVALTSRDVTAARQREADILEAQRALAESEQRLRDITDNLPVLIAYIDHEERLTFANDTARRWYGLDLSRVLGRPLREVLGEAHYAERRGALHKALSGERVQFEVVSTIRGRPHTLQMTYIPDRREDGRIAGVYGLSTDVTELKDIQVRLAEMAHLDNVTGLPNRNRFDEVLPLAIKRAARHPAPLALLFLDIDRFKAINDSHGHAAGDRVLREFGQRLLESVRATDTVARLAGDEFVVLLEGVAGVGEAERIAEKIVQRVKLPIDLDGQPLQVSTSIGIAMHRPGSGESPSTLLRRADEALYAAKGAGRDAWRVAPA